MKIYKDVPREQWKEILLRPYADNAPLLESVKQLMEAVRTGGDAALFALTEKFDGAKLTALEVSEAELAAAESWLDAGLKSAIRAAAGNIESFHRVQLSPPVPIETVQGIHCWRKSVGIEKVGIYVPGGSAPLFSTVLMLGIPAALAGCKDIVLCTPCSPGGDVHPAILFAARLVGIKRIFKIGGAQAVAAMAYGTETVPAVYKIFGPGNQYVTAAKQLVQMEGLSIDMPAGPSEVCIWADETADPRFVAADLLSQAEHGPDSQVLLVSRSEELVKAVVEEVTRQLGLLPRKAIAGRAMENSRAIVAGDDEEALDLVNAYAAEHLIISCKEAETLAERVVNAGSVFIGNYTPESLGDYASGTNHTLPTNGFARAYSGVSVDSFVKTITFQKASFQGLKNISGTVVAMAEAEGLKAHAEAVRIRLS
ncbi:MAG TPA: histidinol dehydrogenase [Flavisolibacter sp.]|nr:histidinol dehydrogenase [Flavisolibacter sp.]